NRENISLPLRTFGAAVPTIHTAGLLVFIRHGRLAIGTVRLRLGHLAIDIRNLDAPISLGAALAVTIGRRDSVHSGGALAPSSRTAHALEHGGQLSHRPDQGHFQCDEREEQQAPNGYGSLCLRL